MKDSRLCVILMTNDSTYNQLHSAIVREWIRKNIGVSQTYDLVYLTFKHGKNYEDSLEHFKNTLPDNITDILLVTQVPCAYTLEVFYHVVDKVGKNHIHTLYSPDTVAYEPIELRSMGLVELVFDDNMCNDLYTASQPLVKIERSIFGTWTADISSAVKVDISNVSKNKASPIPLMRCYWNVI